MDRLIEAIEDKQNPSVVGLDPTDKLVPAPVMDAYAVEAEEQVESDDNLQPPLPQQRISIQSRHHRCGVRHRACSEAADRHV